MWRKTFSRILDRNGRSEMGWQFFKRFLSSDGFFNRGLIMAVFRSSDNPGTANMKTCALLLKLVSWCFMPSQPVQLYQGDYYLNNSANHCLFWDWSWYVCLSFSLSLSRHTHAYAHTHTHTHTQTGTCTHKNINISPAPRTTTLSLTKRSEWTWVHRQRQTQRFSLCLFWSKISYFNCYRIVIQLDSQHWGLRLCSGSICINFCDIAFKESGQNSMQSSWQ